MKRDLTWVLSLSGTALAVSFLWLGYRAHASSHASHRKARESLGARLERLELAAAQAATLPGQARPGPASASDLEGLVEDLRVRLTLLEGATLRSAAETEEGEQESRQGTPPTRGTGEAGRTPEPGGAERLELEGLLAELAGGGWDVSGSPGSRESYERFLELARGTGLLDERIADLEARVAAFPGDVEARMELADSFVGKLMTVAGPEQGLWGDRAEEQWLAVVGLDDGRWDAHASLGTNYGYYPDVMGKTPDAILHLERAREIQRTMEPAPEHVEVYLFLARMYEREGKPDEARDVLEEGLLRHRGNRELEEALARLRQG